MGQGGLLTKTALAAIMGIIVVTIFISMFIAQANNYQISSTDRDSLANYGDKYSDYRTDVDENRDEYVETKEGGTISQQQDAGDAQNEGGLATENLKMDYASLISSFLTDLNNVLGLGKDENGNAVVLTLLLAAVSIAIISAGWYFFRGVWA